MCCSGGALPAHREEKLTVRRRGGRKRAIGPGRQCCVGEGWHRQPGSSDIACSCGSSRWFYTPAVRSSEFLSQMHDSFPFPRGRRHFFPKRSLSAAGISPRGKRSPGDRSRHPPNIWKTCGEMAVSRTNPQAILSAIG